jgi:hypothetical protein
MVAAATSVAQLLVIFMEDPRLTPRALYPFNPCLGQQKFVR